MTETVYKDRQGRTFFDVTDQYVPCTWEELGEEIVGSNPKIQYWLDKYAEGLAKEFVKNLEKVQEEDQ